MMTSTSASHAQEASTQANLSAASESERLAPQVGNGALASVLSRVAAGRPLDRTLGAEFEPAFRVDLGAVRIHDNARAVDAAFHANAQAFTYGEHIVLDANLREVRGRAGGRKLLTHELAHVIQQRGGGSREPSPAPTEPLEAEADAAATAIARGGTAQALAGTAVGIARANDRDPAGLSDEQLTAEHEATDRWLLDHTPGDPGYQDTLDYFQRLEQEVSGRSAVSPAPASPASSTPAAATSSSSQSASYQALGDEELCELARQGDTDAAAVYAKEVADRAAGKAVIDTAMAQSGPLGELLIPKLGWP